MDNKLIDEKGIQTKELSIKEKSELEKLIADVNKQHESIMESINEMSGVRKHIFLVSYNAFRLAANGLIAASSRLKEKD